MKINLTDKNLIKFEKEGVEKPGCPLCQSKTIRKLETMHLIL